MRGLDSVLALEDVLAGLREDDDGVGARADAARECAMLGRRVGQHGMQRDDDRLVDEFDKVGEPLAAIAAIEAVLVLHVEQRGGVRVDQRGDDGI